MLAGGDDQCESQKSWSSTLTEKPEIKFFLQNWILNFSKRVSAVLAELVMICHVALVAIVFGNEKSAVSS